MVAKFRSRDCLQYTQNLRARGALDSDDIKPCLTAGIVEMSSEPSVRSILVVVRKL